MNTAITTQFIKGITSPNDPLLFTLPQVALIGRSNAGKSTLINTLVQKKGLARTSSFPGATKEINLFLVNNSLHLLDLPGYGYTRDSVRLRTKLESLIHRYITTEYRVPQTIVLITDAFVGPTPIDIALLELLTLHSKQVIVLANKIDKINKTQRPKQLAHITSLLAPYPHTLFVVSGKEKLGVDELRATLFSSTNK